MHRIGFVYLSVVDDSSQVLLVAKRSIKAGEEVTDNYGIHHLSFPLEERQEKLHKGFKFCCWCEGCQKDFPRMKSLRTQLPEDVEDRFDKLREEIMELFRFQIRKKTSQPGNIMSFCNKPGRTSLLSASR